MQSQKKIRRLIGVIGVGILLFTGAHLPEVEAQPVLDIAEEVMSDDALFREIELQEASVPTLQVWNLSSREVKEAKLNWAIAERGKAAFATVQADEISLLHKRLDQSFDRLSQNISKEASHHSDYVLYARSHRLHDFWQDLGQLKQEQGEMIQRIIVLETSLKGQIPASAYKAGVNKTQSASQFSGPGTLAKMFSHWRGFYFLISGGFFLINVSLFFACIELERSGRYRENFVPYRKAA